MGVVTKYGDGYKDPAATKQIDATRAEARVLAIMSQITITNGDSNTSQYFVGRVPSNSILLPNGTFDRDAIAGNTAFSLGFAGALTALVNALDAHTAALGTSALSAVTAPNRNQRAWVAAGLASDPGGMLDIIASIGADATGTGTMTFFIPYARK